MDPGEYSNCAAEMALDLIEESYAEDWRKDETELPSTSSDAKKSKNKLKNNTSKVTLKHCDYCNFSTPFSFNLKRHNIRIHLNIYSFTCSTCGQHFKDGDTLNRHIHQVHDPIELFPCSICNKSFKRLYDLNRHDSIVHNPQQVYACPYCANLFTSTSNCQRHIKKRCHLRPLNKT